MLLRVIIRPLVDVSLEVCALLDAMRPQRIMPRTETIFIRVPAHPVRTGITWGIGLKISDQKAVGLAGRYPVTRHDTLPAPPKQTLGDAFQLMRRCCTVMTDAPTHVC
jgi:hypothetical protein